MTSRRPFWQFQAMGRRAGFFTTLARISREVERAERQRMREAAAQVRAHRQLATAERKLQEYRIAEAEVEEFESTLAALTSVHRECSSRIDWRQVAQQRPTCDRSASTRLHAEIAAFRPSFIERLFGSHKRREQLETALAAAEARESLAWQEANAEAEEMRRLAAAVLGGHIAAYDDVISATGCLDELAELGCQTTGRWLDSQTAWMTLRVGGSEMVPSEAKALTASGKLSTKRIPINRQQEIYQDFVCGAALRAARELSAVLPLSAVLCDVHAPVLDTSTGHTPDTVVLSVFCPSSRLSDGRVNFAMVDASDLVSTFKHSMKLVRGKGFRPVEALAPSRAMLGA